MRNLTFLLCCSMVAGCALQKFTVAQPGTAQRPSSYEHSGLLVEFQLEKEIRQRHTAANAARSLASLGSVILISEDRELMWRPHSDGRSCPPIRARITSGLQAALLPPIGLLATVIGSAWYEPALPDLTRILCSASEGRWICNSAAGELPADWTLALQPAASACRSSE